MLFLLTFQQENFQKNFYTLCCFYLAAKIENSFNFFPIPKKNSLSNIFKRNLISVLIEIYLTKPKKKKEDILLFWKKLQEIDRDKK